MTEDELLTAIGEALTLAGWRWHHDRRSDKAITQGTPGFPDIIAVHPIREDAPVLAWELKTERGRPTDHQIAWAMALDGSRGCIDVRLVRPANLDEALTIIFGPMMAVGVAS